MNPGTYTGTLREQLASVLAALPTHEAITPHTLRVIDAWREFAEVLASIPLSPIDRTAAVNASRAALVEALARLLNAAPGLIEVADEERRRNDYHYETTQSLSSLIHEAWRLYRRGNADEIREGNP